MMTSASNDRVHHSNLDQSSISRSARSIRQHHQEPLHMEWIATNNEICIFCPLLSICRMHCKWSVWTMHLESLPSSTAPCNVLACRQACLLHMVTRLDILQVTSWLDRRGKDQFGSCGQTDRLTAILFLALLTHPEL